MSIDDYLPDCSELRAAGAGRYWLCRLLRPTLGKKLGLVFCAVAALVAAQHVQTDRYLAASRGIAAQIDAIGSLRWSSQRLLLEALAGQPAAGQALREKIDATLAVLDTGGALRGARVPPPAEEAREGLAELQAGQMRLARALDGFRRGEGGFAPVRTAADNLLQTADRLNAHLALRQQALEGSERSRLWLVSLLIASLLLALLVLLRLRVVQPLRTLAALSRDFAEGRYGRRSGFRSLDEIGQLAFAFDAMADTIERDLRQLADNAAELARREQALRKFSLAIEHGPASVIITDAEGRIEYVNPKFVEITGYAPEEVIGRNPGFLKSGEMPRQVYDEMRRNLRAGREWHGELLNRKKNGEPFWEDTSIAPLKDERGRITHFVAVKEDVSARKLAEAQIREYNAELERQVAERTRHLEASNRELEAFSYSISHDLRAPLRAINGFASLMTETCKDCGKAEAQEYLGRIRRASLRMGSLIDDILELSRVTRREIEMREVDLRAGPRRLRSAGRCRAGAAGGGRSAGRSDGARRRDPAAQRAGEPARQCLEVHGALRTGAHRIRPPRAAGGRGSGVFRARQRRRLRHAVRRQAVRRLPAPAPGAGIRGQRHRPGHGAAHRRAARRPHLGRGGGGAGRDLLFHAGRRGGRRACLSS
mgnify:CR=1 FL=1